MGKTILSNKIYLYLTEFFAGMSVMAIELGASRLLAPYFSSSQIVWTIIIGTIMIAMALGNIWGGRSADKNPDPARLYKRLLIAAVWIAAIPFAGKYIIVLVSGAMALTISNGFLIAAALVSCLLIFVFPLFLLGTVTPSLVKYTVDSLDDSGRIVGTLGAFNTIGSIIGTFLPTFVTIPAVGTSITFILFSGVLMVLGLVYFITEKRKAALCIVTAVLYAAFSILGHGGGFAFWENDLEYEGESVYNYLQVKEDSESVRLSTNVMFGVQSVMMKEDRLTGMYYDYALAAPLMSDAGEDAEVLILGMGTGTYAKQLMRYYSPSGIEGVEIDSKITALAREYFDLPEEIKVTTYDGRAYLQAVDKKYDVIMVDAYQDITIPFQMSSAEFFTLVKEHLNPGGVMVVNLNMNSKSEGSVSDYISDTVDSVFKTVCSVRVPASTNAVLFASQSSDMLGNLNRRILQIGDSQLAAFLGNAADKIVNYYGGDLILTDDKAPVELLGIKAIDDIITDELDYYKEMFRKYGIFGVLDRL